MERIDELVDGKRRIFQNYQRQPVLSQVTPSHKQ
jgi:hypothetical protein